VDAASRDGGLRHSRRSARGRILCDHDATRALHDARARGAIAQSPRQHDGDGPRAVARRRRREQRVRRRSTAVDARAVEQQGPALLVHDDVIAGRRDVNDAGAQRVTMLDPSDRQADPRRQNIHEPRWLPVGQVLHDHNRHR